MKEQSIGEGSMRNHNVRKCNRTHRGLVREIVESETSQHWIELRILHALADESHKPCLLKKFRRKESAHYVLLPGRQRGGAGCVSDPLGRYVLSNQHGYLVYLFAGEIRHPHVAPSLMSIRQFTPKALFDKLPPVHQRG